MNKEYLIQKLIPDDLVLQSLVINESTARGFSNESIVDWITAIQTNPDMDPLSLLPTAKSIRKRTKSKTTYRERVKIRFKWAKLRKQVFNKKLGNYIRAVQKQNRDDKFRKTWKIVTDKKISKQFHKLMSMRKWVIRRQRGLIYGLTGMRFNQYDCNINIPEPPHHLSYQFTT